MMNLVVEVVVKEHNGRFAHKVDVFSGSPEECASILESKYCNTKSLFARIYRSLNVAEEEFLSWVNKNK